MANQTYPRAEVESEVEPMRPAEERFTARIDLSKLAPHHPNQLGAMRALIQAFTAVNVPDDAYVQLSYPTAWATWRREPHG